MQVPLKRTPGTSVVALEQPYARAVAPLDFSPITRQLEGFAKALTAKKDDLEEFDLKSRLIQETNELQSDFERRKEAAPLGDQNFTHQTLQDYEERHNKLVAEYQGQGYSEKALNDFSLRLGTLREHFGEQALAYQVHSTAVASDTKVDELTTRASQYAANNPVTGYTSTINEVNHSIDLLPGDATYKEERKQRARAIIRQGGLAAMARMHPEQVITALDPNGLTAPPAEPVGGAYDVVSGAIAPPAAAGGFDAAVEHVLGHEGGYNPSDMNGAPVNFGINQKANPDLNVKNLTREQAKQVYHDRYWVPSGAEQLPANMQAPYFDVYIRNPKFAKRALAEADGDPAKFMQLSSQYFETLAATPAGKKYKKAWENRDAHNLAIATGGAPAPVRAATPVSTPQQVMGYNIVTNPDPTQWGVRTDGSPKGTGWLGPLQRPDGQVSTEISVGVEIDGKEQEVPLMVPGLTKPELDYLMTHDPQSRSFQRNMPRSIMGKAVAHAEQQLKAGQSPFKQDDAGADQEIVVTGQRPPDLESVRTGIAILDDSTGAERLQALLQAREETNRKSTALKSSLDIVVANADAAIGLQGGYHGPVPSKETFIQAYGPIEGEQKYAAFASSLHTNQVVQTMQTLSPTAVQAQVESLRPNPTSPTLAQDMQRYEAAQRAQAHVMQLRKDDPAAYVLQAYPDIAAQMQHATTSEGRRAAYSAMERAFDQLQIPENERTYLTDDARAQMVAQYKTASPQQKLGLIETWMNEMGGRPGRLLHGEVDTNQDVAMYRTLSSRGGDFRRTFLQVLEGQDIIAKDPARKPSPEAMISAFTSLPGRIAAINNLNPDVSRMYNEAAAALYVYRGGRVDPATKAVDKNLYDQAIREVMGGTDPKGGFANFGHGKAPDHTILPPGVSSTEFEHWRDSLAGSTPQRVGDLTRLSVRGLPPTDNRGHLLTLHDIQDQGVFVMVAPGTYGIKMSGDGNFVGDKTGQPFLLRLDRKRMGLR